jgi:hypothetical protein
VIFLHRSVDALADQWILRTDQIAASWKDGWEELIALRVVSNPITIFIGLGTPAAVLVESVSKVRAAVPGGTRVYQVDVGDKQHSAYFAALHLTDDDYIQMGWTQFMEELSARVLAEQCLQLERGCREARAAGETRRCGFESNRYARHGGWAPFPWSNTRAMDVEGECIPSRVRTRVAIHC